MPGPPPKDPALRQRRNKTSTASSLGAHHIGQWPPLPEGDWLPETEAWWESLKNSPMKAEFIKADIPVLVRLARLVDDLGQTRASLAGLLGLKEGQDEVVAQLRQVERLQPGSVIMELMSAIELRARLNDQGMKLQRLILNQEAEVRAHEQRYGLTPLDRRRLQWTVEPRAKRAAPRTKPIVPSGQGPAPDSDPRLRLLA